MESLTPIPTPPAQRWREFRIQALPVIVFIGVIACIGILWHRYVFPSNIVAQVEAISANVLTTVPGTLSSIQVGRFQKVRKGDPVAVIDIAETNLLYASIDAARASLDVIRTRIDLDEFRSGQVYERERLSFLQQKVQLMVDRVNEKLYEAEYHVQEELYTNATMRLINSNTYNVAFYKWESAKVKVREMEEFLKQKEMTLPKLAADSTNAVKAIEADIIAQQAKLIAAVTNVIIRAPMDGVVSMINVRPGERVMGGTPIAIITSSQADKIIAYMRQPITTVPKPGDTLQVRRRTFKRQAAVATVRDVGSQLEPIIPALVAVAGAPKVDLGLPFAINMPPSLGLIPGEVVDIIYERRND